MPSHTHVLAADGTTAASSNSNTPDPSGGKVLGQSAGSGGTPPAAFAANIYSSSAPNVALNSACVAATGGSQPHDNLSPYLALNVIIALQGIFPSPN